jgi:integrase
VALKNEINRARVVFKFAHDQRLIERLVHFGQSFNRPTAKALRKSRNAAGRRMFEATELRRILDAMNGRPIEVQGKDKPVIRKADPVLKAMVLLGLNCGFGNTDVSTLPLSALDLDKGWVDFPRPKTEIERRIPLWPETVEAIRAAIAARRTPAGREYSDLCFVTRSGMPFVRVQQQTKNPEKIQPLDALTQKFSKVLHLLKIDGRRGLGFYTLRHVFETIGGESRDQVAVNAIMGHVDSSMAGQYRERISDERLQGVVETVRTWLRPGSVGEGQ